MSAVLTPSMRAAVGLVTGALGLDAPRITPLPGGIANRSLRLQDASHDLVLKLTGSAARELGANGDAECAMQSLASAAGLAPPVVFFDRARGVLVSSHVDGRRLSQAELREPPALERLGVWLRALHALPPPAGLPVVDFGARAAELLAGLRGDFHAALARGLAARRAALGAAAGLAACHHDLHPGNLIEQRGRLLAVDFEYAGPGDPAADIAACIGYHDLDGTRARRLLDAYGAGAALQDRVAALGWIFDCLWYGWNAAAARTGTPPDPARQARLAGRLAG